MIAKTYEDWVASGKNIEKEADDDNIDDEDRERLFREAAQAYAKAAALEPQSWSALYDWARCTFIAANLYDVEDEDDDERSNMLRTAINKFRASLKIKPDYGPCLYNLAQALIANADIKEETFFEEEDSNEALAGEIRAEYNEALELLDRVYAIQTVELQDGLPQEKPVTKDDLVETLTSQAECFVSLAHLEEDAEAYEPLFSKSIQKIQDAIALHPEKKSKLCQEWANVIEGQLEKRHEEGDIESAQEIDYSAVLAKLDEAIEADRKNADAYCDKGDVLMNVARNVLLFYTLRQSQSDGEDKELNFPEDVQQNALKGYDDAIVCYELAVQHGEDSTSYLQRLGDAYLQRGKADLPIARPRATEFVKKASEVYQKAYDMDKEDEELVARVALALYSLNSADEKVSELLKEYEQLDGSIDQLLNEPEVFDEEFLAKVADTISDAEDGGWEDESDSESDSE